MHADGSTSLLPDGRWKARGERLVIVVDVREAAVIVEIYERYVHRGWGLGAIANLLNARFEPPPTSGRGQGGRPVWTKPTLWALLRNPAYIGRRVFGKARYSEIGRKQGKVTRAAPPACPSAMRYGWRPRI